MTRRSAAVFVLSAALTACSGSAPTSTPNGSANAAPAAKSSGGAVKTPSGSARASQSSGGTTTSSSARATPSAKVRATLDRSCVVRGDQKTLQGISVTARPGGATGYNTIYSDGSSSVDGTSHYDSGYGGGFADSSGNFRQTWVVPANAPAGRATVRVVAIEDTTSGPAQETVDLHFVVATAAHPC